YRLAVLPDRAPDAHVTPHRSGRADLVVPVVHHREDVERIHAKVHVRALGPAPHVGQPDGPRSEARPRTIRDRLVDGRPEDGDVRAGKVLRVQDQRHLREGRAGSGVRGLRWAADRDAGHQRVTCPASASAAAFRWRWDCTTVVPMALATSTGSSRTSAADSPMSARVLITFHASAWNVRDVRPSRTSRARHSRKSPGRTGDRNSTCSYARSRPSSPSRRTVISVARSPNSCMTNAPAAIVP